MIAAFFADDPSGGHAALLASSAFDRLSAAGDGAPSLLAGGERIVGALPDALDDARVRGRHLMVALPLAQLGNRAVRSRVDLTVVSFGPRPLAAAMALAAISANALDGISPPWLLACCGRALPSGLRVLPMTLKALRREKAARLLAGEPGADTRVRSVGLAAALHLAAEEPHASRIEPGRLGALFDAANTAAELRLRSSLLELAADLDGDDGDLPQAHGPTGRTAPSTARRKPGVPGRRRCGVAKPHAAPRHAVGCACANRA